MFLKRGMHHVMRQGAASSTAVLIGAFLNLQVLTGIVCYVVGTLSWMLVLSRMDLSVAYPLGGMAHIGVVLVSWLFLGETVRPQRWMGVLFIVIGLLLVANS